MTNQELPESLRDPFKVIERGRVLLQLTEQRNAAWDEIERLRAGLEEIAHVTGDHYNRCWMRVKAREILRKRA